MFDRELPRTRKLRGRRQCQDCPVCSIASGRTGAHCPKLEKEAVRLFHTLDAAEEEASELAMV